jgi:hypothetical protein
MTDPVLKSIRGSVHTCHVCGLTSDWCWIDESGVVWCDDCADRAITQRLEGSDAQVPDFGEGPIYSAINQMRAFELGAKNSRKAL